MNTNQIKSIPKEIGKLTKLFSLQIASNQLTEIPKEIENLKDLYVLSLENNQLTEVIDITKFPNLFELGLARNDITKLPKNYGDSPTLKLIWLNANHIVEIPEGFNVSNDISFHLEDQTVILPEIKIPYNGDLVVQNPISTFGSPATKLVVSGNGNYSPNNNSIIWSNVDTLDEKYIYNHNEYNMGGNYKLYWSTKVTQPFSFEDDPNKPLLEISLNKTTINLGVDKTSLLTVIYNPTDTTDSKEVTWSSSAPEIAHVYSNGKVKGVSPGTAVITATVGNKTATCSVTVN